MSCGNINQGSQPDCPDLPEQGTRARLILMNYNDVERIYVNDDGKIISVEMKSGKVGYEFLGFNSDVKKNDDVIKTRRKNRFRHSVNFIIYQRDQLQKNNIKAISKGRFFGIIENKGHEEDSIEFLGKNVGLQIIPGQVRNAYESGGLFTIGLETPNNGIEFEPKLPQTVGTSYTNGLQIINDILGIDSVSFDSDLITMDQTDLTFDMT